MEAGDLAETSLLPLGPTAMLLNPCISTLWSHHTLPLIHRATVSTNLHPSHGDPRSPLVEKKNRHEGL